MIPAFYIAALAFAWQGDPGPLDAFQANYAAIQVDLDYEYRMSRMLDPGSIDPTAVWTGQPLAFPEDEDQRIVGRWACDGRAEYFEAGSPSEWIRLRQREPRIATESHANRDAPGTFADAGPYMSRIEALWDPSGPTLASHTVEGRAMLTQKIMVQVWQPAAAGILSRARGPFIWWLNDPFPMLIHKHFEGISPRRVRAVTNGHHVEIEIYRRDIESIWIQFEVSYDPAIGYLPRHARLFVVEGGKASFNELYVTRAEPCAAGGFVIVEWYEARFQVPNFIDRYPDYDYSAKVRPADRFTIGHFRASNLRDRGDDPVALTKLEDVRHLTTNGAVVDLPRGLRSLSMPQIRRRLGERLTNPRPAALMTIDRQELAEYSPPMPERRTPRIPIVLGAAVIVIIGGVAFRRARRASLGLALIIPPCLGCQGPTPPGPEVRLRAAFEPDRIACDWDSPSIRSSLVISNEGRGVVRLVDADGGCSCRKVDASGFPIDLPSGSSVSLNVEMANPRTEMPKVHPFTLQTDAGNITIGARLQTLPRHPLHPEAINHSILSEAQDWSFDLTHRAIFPTVGPSPDVEFFLPDGFEKEEIGAKSGDLHDAPGYRYRDVSYRLRLTNPTLGLHRSEILLRSPDHRTVARSIVVWKRSPYLSSVPDRVILGPRPFRLFLRCPDQGVELTEVRSAPPGVRAVVSSTRELTVILDEHPPEIIDGIIEVDTTAEGRPPLRVPVIRYAPVRDSSPQQAM